MLQSLLSFCILCFLSKIRLTSSVPERAFSISYLSSAARLSCVFCSPGTGTDIKGNTIEEFSISLGFIRTDFQTHLLCPGHPNLLDPPGARRETSPQPGKQGDILSAPNS